MKIALYGRPFDPKFDKEVLQMLNFIKSAGFEIWVFNEFADFLKKRLKIEPACHIFHTGAEIFGKVEMLLSVGGDGTMLQSAKIVGASRIPVLGINTGRLGFLSGVAATDVEKALAEIKDGEFELESRSMLQLKTQQGLFDKENFALNELTVHKRDSASMITIHTYIDGNYLNSYWADGLIISTPTGSTGYSLSCGGPIIYPVSESFVITPIAPHNLNVRPFLVPDSSVITLKVEGRKEKFLVSLDSHSENISSNIELSVVKAPFTFNLVKLKQEHFFTTLRNKLNWGMDKRN